jgi:AraC-like DNA-binding protein
LPIPLGRSLLVTSSNCSRSGYSLHSHSCYELIGFQRVGASRTVGDNDGYFGAGEVYLLAPYVPHTFYTHGFLPRGQSFGMTIVWFQPRLVEEAALPELNSLWSMLSKARRGLLFPKTSGLKIQTQMQALENLTGAAALARFYLLMNRLLEWSSQGVEVSQEEMTLQTRGNEVARLDAIRDYLELHCAESLSLDQVSEKLNVSPSTLNHLLKKYYKLTYLGLLTQLRMTKAKQLLRTSHIPVTEIAFQAGFTSLATFNRRFRQDERKSPREFRKQQLS